MLSFAIQKLILRVQASHLQEKDNFALLEQARIIYSAGFFLTASAESMLLAAKHAAANNKIYCVNISAPFLLQVPCHSVALVPPGPFSLACVYQLPLPDGCLQRFAQHKQHNRCVGLGAKMFPANCRCFCGKALWKVCVAYTSNPRVFNLQCRFPPSRRLSQKLCHMWTSCLAMRPRPRPLLNLKAGKQRTSLKLLERCGRFPPFCAVR